MGGGALRVVLAHQLPEGAAVVGMAQVAKLVDAHIVLNACGGANQPPVELDTCARATYAPKGFGAGKADGGGDELQALAVGGEFGQQGGMGSLKQVLAQQIALLGGVGLLRQPEKALTVAAFYLGDGGGAQGVGGTCKQDAGRQGFRLPCQRGVGLLQDADKRGFVVAQPVLQLGRAEPFGDAEVEAAGIAGADDDVALGVAFDV